MARSKNSGGTGTIQRPLAKQFSNNNIQMARNSRRRKRSNGRAFAMMTRSGKLHRYKSLNKKYSVAKRRFKNRRKYKTIHVTGYQMPAKQPYRVRSYYKTIRK